MAAYQRHVGTGLLPLATVGPTTDDISSREPTPLMRIVSGLALGRRATPRAAAAQPETALAEAPGHDLPAPPCCPRCTGRHVVKYGSARGLQRFKCRACGKTFNALTGTPLAGLHKRDKWLAQAEAIRDGLSLNQAAERLDIAQSTAFRWRRRFMTLPRAMEARQLAGVKATDRGSADRCEG